MKSVSCSGPGRINSDQAVFLWERELAVAGSIELVLQTDKDCAGIVWAQACHDWLLQKSGRSKRISSEVLYTGSRSIIGKNSRNDPGCYLSWVMRFIVHHGVVVRELLPPFDLREYNPAFIKEFSRQPLPLLITERLQPLHKVFAFELPEPKIGQVKSLEDVWKVVGLGFSLPFVCQSGFALQRDEEGICLPYSRWDHAMLIRGRCFTRSGQRCFVVQNSIGDYLGDINSTITLLDGRQIKLPAGFFLVPYQVFSEVVRLSDVFVIC